MPTEHPAEQQQLLPGVEYRTETRQRLVPHAVNGKTRLVEEDYEVMVPAPPRDWDQAVTTAVTAVAALLVTVAVVWSVASIGDLLARAVIAPSPTSPRARSPWPGSPAWPWNGSPATTPPAPPLPAGPGTGP